MEQFVRNHDICLELLLASHVLTAWTGLGCERQSNKSLITDENKEHGPDLETTLDSALAGKFS